VPALALDVGLLLDRLSLFFALVVSGMGVLVCTYATSYMHDRPRDLPRFFALLLFFMGAMLGVVLSSNLLALFLFWELTGLASFLLIGFETDSREGQRGARMALLTTAATGLLLMVGVILLGEAYGTLDLTRILATGATPVSPDAAAWAVPFLLAGAFGKSAQFPLHYWLPNAMAAPTPVSAYLHSATMVKLGVFLVARLSPAFAGMDAWNATLLWVCFSTAAVGSLLSFLSHDLKAILAYTTVAQLGVLMGFFALGNPATAGTDLLHVLAHVFYKGGLFMLAGIVDHATGTRDLRKLGGLGRRSPAMAACGFILCLSLASLPGCLAFVSKETILADFLSPSAALSEAQAQGALALFAIASVLKVAIAARLFLHLFVRREPHSALQDANPSHFHAPDTLILAPVALLAVASLLFGLFPWLLEPILARAAAGGRSPGFPALSLWHGVNAPFLWSVALTAAGFSLYGITSKYGWDRLRIPRALAFDRGFDWLLDALMASAKLSVKVLRADHAREALAVVVGFVSLCGVVTLAIHLQDLVDVPALTRTLSTSALTGEVLMRLIIFLVTVIAGLVAVLTPVILTRLVATSLVGLIVTTIYILFRAPDLALTQILVETLVLVATVVLLIRLRTVEILPSEQTRGLRRVVHLFVAIAAGALMAGLTMVASSRGLSDFERLGTTYLARTVPDAAGTNAVNTILVDFRGTDTLFEITVLVIAVLGCIGLVSGARARKLGGSTDV
jgi:NADH:ubiquinone oxidoreductase subunit 5 (subunit L)/multisubunit Na+/H+ antiporter MnhA subunit